MISAADSVTGHTATLCRLLKRNGIPTVVFVNKMDLAIRKKEEILSDLTEAFGPGFVDFSPERGREEWEDDLTLHSEELMEDALSGRGLTDDAVADSIRRREIFPVYFGSALRQDGITGLLDGIRRFLPAPAPQEEFAARVFKIARDDAGERLAFLRIYGGTLSVRQPVRYETEDGEVEEKIHQIRIYSGRKYRAVETAEGGQVAAVTGLTRVPAGAGLGGAAAAAPEVLQPFLRYTVIPAAGTDLTALRQCFRELSEEDPKLHAEWDDAAQQIRIRMMGDVQLEVLQRIVRDRFGFSVEFGTGKILYRETIREAVEGFGHFEPLRHYAEVHLILEPADRGSGITIDSSLSEDVLDRNWQHLILSALEEEEPVGVLTGSPVTDVKITLAAGKASRKHTSGGDFREASCRALRNGLRRADCVLLEPWYRFTMELPKDAVGRAMTDVGAMGGSMSEPEPEPSGMTILRGTCPASEMLPYQRAFSGMTHGEGRLQLSPAGFRECHNAEEVIRDIGYDPDRDVLHPADSVFTSHGTSEIVSWEVAPEKMHVPPVLRRERVPEETLAQRAKAYREELVTDSELMAIFERTYGPVKKNVPGRGNRAPKRPAPSSSKPEKKKTKTGRPVPTTTHIFVDGYNVIYSWKRLQDLAQEDYNAARSRLIDILCNYQGFTQSRLTLVFDAYKVPGGSGRIENAHNIEVVYTKEDETADAYIERATREAGKDSRVIVVTSDAMIQQIALGHGAVRVSSREFEEEVGRIEEAIRRELRKEY